MYRLSARAKTDLLEIAHYTQRKWGETQAKTYIGGLEEFCGLLAGFPGIGRACETIAPQLRRMEHESHVVFFFPAEDGILVSRFFHKSRDISDEEFDEFG
jgi:toxin ParE1/3/4